MAGKPEVILAAIPGRNSVNWRNIPLTLVDADRREFQGYPAPNGERLVFDQTLLLGRESLLDQLLHSV